MLLFVCATVLFGNVAFGRDSILIKRVRSAKNPDTGLTVYKVVIEYKHTSSDPAQIAVGFDINDPGNYVMLSFSKIRKGSETVEIACETPATKRSVLTVMANIAPDPIPKNGWRPEAVDVMSFKVDVTPNPANKSSQSTTPSVTPPAGQEARQP